MTIFIILFVATIFLAYANGANDNFKGVATLFGSKTTNYSKAIRWATLTTILGSFSSIILAEKLLKNFSGKGLVPAEITAAPEFLTSVAIGSGLTVLFTALRGLPISTTHSLVGGLVGSGIMAIGSDVNFQFLGKTFFIPLLVSPFIAVLLAYTFYSVFRLIEKRFGLNKNWCLCIGLTNNYENINGQTTIYENQLTTHSDTKQNCDAKYSNHFLGISFQKILDNLHFLSAGIVCFARGLNDTPKIFALLIAVPGISIQYGMIAVAFGMAIGGLLNARRIAETISNKITPIKHEQGFAANLVTGFLVIFASRLGIPVSTTHVSVGSIFGISLLTGQGNKKVISNILISWLLTLPVAGLLSAVTYYLINSP